MHHSRIPDAWATAARVGRALTVALSLLVIGCRGAQGNEGITREPRSGSGPVRAADLPGRGDAGIDCACPRTGGYRVPTSPAVPVRATQPPRGGTFSAREELRAGRLEVTISRGSTALVRETLPAGSMWGFSPDGMRVIFDSVRADGQRDLVLYDLSRDPAARVTAASATVGADHFMGFSPSGRFLVTASLAAPGVATVRVQDAATGAERHRDEIRFAVPRPEVRRSEPFGILDWGFVDASERTFAYSYPVGPLEMRLELANLARSVGIFGENLNLAFGHWSFSPCGDVLAVVQPQFSDRDRSVTLVTTLDGAQLTTTSATNPPAFQVPEVELATLPTAHVAITPARRPEFRRFRDTVQLADNTAPRTCSQ
jgi:hypothetical protein